MASYEAVELEVKKQKAYRALIKDWIKESREAGRTFCQSCARQDFNNDRLASSWTEYTDLEKVGESIIYDKKSQLKIGTMNDYKCARGHGISSEDLLPTDAYGRRFDPEKLKSEEKKTKKGE